MYRTLNDITMDPKIIIFRFNKIIFKLIIADIYTFYWDIFSHHIEKKKLLPVVKGEI